MFNSQIINVLTVTTYQVCAMFIFYFMETVFKT